MKVVPFCVYTALVSLAQAQFLIEGASFGQGQTVSPNRVSVPGWQVTGEGQTPQLMSDKIVLTPPYPGNRRGAIWAENKVVQSEWVANFEFRATGPERGGGNMQIWYTKEGPGHIGTSSIYTVGKFDGLVLVLDTHGGSGGSIRAFLNDGNIDFSQHHSVDSLSFGHCDYAYRNLGRPSRIHIRNEANAFEVKVDDRQCISSDKVRLPAEYYFGISAASADTPDSFEAYKFLLHTTPSISREEPRRNSPPSQMPLGQQQDVNSQDQYVPASSPPSRSGDMQDRLQSMSQAIEKLQRDVAKLSSESEQRHQAAQSALTGQKSSIDQRLQSIEGLVNEIRRELNARDYNGQFAKLEKMFKDSHSNLLEGLPHSMTQVITSRSPRIGLLIVITILTQLLLAGSYIVYKRRRASAPKKYL